MNKNRPYAEGIREQIVYCFFFEIEIDESERVSETEIYEFCFFFGI